MGETRETGSDSPPHEALHRGISVFRQMRSPKLDHVLRMRCHRAERFGIRQSPRLPMSPRSRIAHPRRGPPSQAMKSMARKLARSPNEAAPSRTSSLRRRNEGQPARHPKKEWHAEPSPISSAADTADAKGGARPRARLHVLLPCYYDTGVTHADTGRTRPGRNSYRIVLFFKNSDARTPRLSATTTIPTA